MNRLRVLVVLLAAALLVPALALAAVKRGVYIDTKSQTYITTNKAATAIKSVTLPCIDKATSAGANVLSKPIKLSAKGAFSFSGKSTLRDGVKNPVISLKFSGKISGTKATGKVSYAGSAPCGARSFSAKYHGVNPMG